MCCVSAIYQRERERRMEEIKRKRERMGKKSITLHHSFCDLKKKSDSSKERCNPRDKQLPISCSAVHTMRMEADPSRRRMQMESMGR